MRRGAKPVKPKAKSEPPIARKSRKGEGSRVHDLEKRLAEALEQQTATAEILRLISQSPTDVRPVFEAIAASAARLCDAAFSAVTRFEGGLLHLVAVNHVTPEETEAYRSLFPRTPGRHFIMGRAFVDGQPVHVQDVLTDPDYDPRRLEVLQHAGGFRTYLGVPIIRDGVPIGAIGCGQREVRPFTATQIELVKTFADQAVIAIENVRLFTELQDKNRALTQAHEQVTEALEQQTATSEILRVISSSPTDVQPALDTIVESAARLCEAVQSNVQLFDGELMHWCAQKGFSSEAMESIQRTYPMRPDRSQTASRAVLSRSVVNLPDVLDDLEYRREVALKGGGRSLLSVPMMREGRPIGAITVGRLKPGAFPDTQVALLQTFADQAVIAIENVRLFSELQASNRDLTEALDQQTATSEILKVISQSQTDVQPVFDSILESAVRLLHAYYGAMTRVVGDRLERVAGTSTTGAEDPGVRAAWAVPLDGESVHAKAIHDGAPVNIADALTEPGVSDRLRAVARGIGYRSLVAVPLLRHDEAIGTIAVTRREPGRFTDDEIALLQTFADQAVIAIENVRLFTELQEKNRALTQAHGQVTEALEQQTATSEILRVISTSPTDVQPVLDAVAANAARVCGATDAIIMRVEGHDIRRVAHSGPIPLLFPAVRRVTRDSTAGRAILECRPVHVHDILATDVAREYPAIPRPAGAVWRTNLAVPLVRDGVAIGAITVRRTEVRPFTDKQIKLLETFADQAVIAIENVRLFTELQEKNRALTQAHAQVTEALDQQTATAGILRTISQTHTDVQPVFEAIADSLMRLLGTWSALVFTCEGQTLRLVAARGGTPGSSDAIMERFRLRGPQQADENRLAGLVVRTRAVQQVEDVETETRFPGLREGARARGFRSTVQVPMLRDGEVIGIVAVTRREPGAYASTEIALLQTFADQAVIAIENARLFRELEARTAALTRSVDQLTALGEVGRAVSSTLDLETVLTTIVSRAVQLSGLDGGVVHEYDEDAEEFVHRAQAETGGALAAARRAERIPKGQGVIGRTAITLEPVQVSDITVPGAYVGPQRENLIESGIRALLAVPMVREGRLIGCLGVTRNRPGEFLAETIELLRTFATQSALAIQNARLFHEIEDKSRQLEAASRHKSEFLANMSHELRTPLNAIIGFSEVLAERMFGEVNAKQAEYLQDILESGRHLLSLINDILDLSKIEAGRMELEAADFDLPSAIDNALILVRERATRRGITLGRHLDEELGVIHGDERKVKQVLLNLLSNALKFTPEGGRIDVRAALREGLAEVSVADTGVGIAPEDQEAVFEEFRQVGTADKKVEGTGLGLALSQKFVQLHGGRIWVESELGRGSTFTFTLPGR